MAPSPMPNRASVKGSVSRMAAGGSRHQRREDHHQRVHTDQLVEELRLHQLQPGLEEFGPDGKDHQAADEEHDQRKSQVHRADVLVIRRRQPAHQAAGIMFGRVFGSVGGGCAHRSSPNAGT